MPKEKSKKSEKSLRLLEALQNKESLSIADIMKLLDCNRQSAYNYINYLEDNGITLEKELRKNKTYISVPKDAFDENNAISFLPVTGRILYKYDIIKTLYNGPADAHILLENGVSESYLYKLLAEMLKNKEIKKEGNLYFLNTETISATLSLTDTEMGKVAQNLSHIPKGHPYYEQLSSIHEKINLTLGNIDSNDLHLDHYIIFGRKHFTFDVIQKELKKLEKIDYPHKVLRVHYLTNAGIERSCLFATGMVVYTLEKDTLYLMGKNYSTEKKYNMLIRLNQITYIEATTQEHTHFNSMEFQDIYNTMFSISVDEPVNVVVEFKNIFNIKKKLMQLCSQRPTAKRLRFVGDNIIYRDTIRGLSDFANYLRRFGRGCKVIEPQELKDMMTFSVERSLQRYLEEEESHD